MSMFDSLSVSRDYSMGGAQPIKVSEIQAYLELMGVDDVDEKIYRLKVVQVLDGVALAHFAKLQKLPVSTPKG